MNLARTQKAVYEMIVGASGAQRASSIVRRLGKLSPAERVDIYRQQYPARMQDSLSEDFPELKKLIGDEAFWRLTLRYSAAHPSEHHDLGAFGRKLPDFLKGHQADLALLEWTRAEIFLEADAEPVSARPRLSPDIRLRLIPGLRVLAFKHDILPLWRALNEGRRVKKPKRGSFHAVVWRKGFDVYHASLSKPETEALQIAARGGTLAEVVTPFADVRAATQAAFKAVSIWFTEGMIAAF